MSYSSAETAHDPIKTALLEAILPHVAFDGWGDVAFDAAVGDSDIDPDAARQTCPRGAVDLAMEFHKQGDIDMRAAMADHDLTDMRIRDKISLAIRLRLQVCADKEAVRRGTILFAMPHLAAEGARLIWGTSDAIWTLLGDTSEDVNYYSKRATLSAVYSSVVLYWLGDDSLDGQATDAFIDRRIDNVMQFEKLKGHMRGNPLVKPFLGPLDALFGQVKAPNARTGVRDDVPGRWTDNK
ncbi:COQ9 family protein [Aestuariibius sp. HNIBRBA575]|uniref:COQ9 family protein n=1 Tax=Aestuariibius sp. HNIBRBA575 TaxID=3233343 RepID=UPI0034A29CA4